MFSRDSIHFLTLSTITFITGRVFSQFRGSAWFFGLSIGSVRPFLLSRAVLREPDTGMAKLKLEPLAPKQWQMGGISNLPDV